MLFQTSVVDQREVVDLDDVPLVKMRRHATQSEIDAYMKGNGGFTVGNDPANGNRIVHSSARFTVLDAEPRNVLIGEDGEFYFIDLIVRRL